jgi:hypothetical protein
MGPADALPADEALACPVRGDLQFRSRYELFVVLVAAAVFHIAAVLPVGGGLLYLLLTRQLLVRRTRERLRPFSGMRSVPGEYHGFFRFCFFNEHLLRLLNKRHPHDYNTVPRLNFWLFHLLWLFPWSAYLPAATRLSYRPLDRGGRMRLLALCWTGFLLVFLTFSSTREYYSMPCYPALAPPIGCTIAWGVWIRAGRIAISTIAAAAAVAILFILTQVWNLPAPGDISSALTQRPRHMRFPSAIWGI